MNKINTQNVKKGWTITFMFPIKRCELKQRAAVTRCLLVIFGPL